MLKRKMQNEIFQTAHLMILGSFTLFAVVLIGESILLGWEKWALMLIGLGVVSGWVMHILHILSEEQRMWLNSAMMMASFFFYGIHQSSTFDLAIVMAAIIMMYTMAGRKLLISLCQVTYYVTMTYELNTLSKDGTAFDALFVTRTLLHLWMIFTICWFSRTIIDKWNKVMESTHREIEQLTDATERLNDFLANVSHELRTPVNAVVGLTGICIDKVKDQEILADLHAVRDAGDRVAEQISDILDYSEIDRGSLALNEEDYMLASVLSDLASELRPFKPPSIELIIDADPAIPAVMHADVGKLKKILSHLIMNGLKYTRDGAVYVRISALPEHYGVNLFIEVTDTGIGMSEEEAERIFERFYQVDSGRSRSASGLGLGLSIVSGFVASMGGFMTLTSNLGSGTTMRVSLPMKVVDPSSCMSVRRRDQLCLGAFLRFDKYEKPEVREYYNDMVRNIVRGLKVQMHRVENLETLKKLLKTVRLTHLFISEREYESDTELMEELASRMIVILVADPEYQLPENTRIRLMPKPFYCFPITAILNMDPDTEEEQQYQLRCSGARALVVDDEPMNLTVARSIFKRYGMDVTTAGSGPEAVTICKNQTFDIIFMDHMMPGMDGIEALKRIRADGARGGSDTPIVMLTANAVSTAKETFLAEGFDGFVSKPIERRELERVLQKVLPRSLLSFVTADEAAAAEPLIPEEESAGLSFRERLERCGVDYAEGLGYCQDDDEFYRSLLMQFASESDEKRTLLAGYYEDQDIKNYEILIHSLKSTSKMIGCAELSEQARALEFAAKEDRIDYIHAHHSEVMIAYTRLTSEILRAGKAEGGDGAMDFLPDGDAGEDDGIMIFTPEGDNHASE